MIYAIIPARSGSVGLPGKNVKILGGMPLIGWSISAALESVGIDDVYVSTDSAAIRDIALGLGAKAPFLRPASLATETATTDDVILHWLHWMQDSRIDLPDHIVLLQPTSPIRLPGSIDGAINLLKAEQADSLLSGNKSHKFLWSKSSDRWLADYDFLNRPMRQAIAENDMKFFENGSIYVSNVNGFLENRVRLFGKISLFEMEEVEGFEIDTLFDWELCQGLILKYGECRR